MKIPKQLKIGGHVYKIIEVENIDNEPNTFGKCWQEKLLIEVRKDLPQSIKEKVLFHEVFHALNWEIEEKDIEWLSMSLYQVLKDNNLLIK